MNPTCTKEYVFLVVLWHDFFVQDTGVTVARICRAYLHIPLWDIPAICVSSSIQVDENEVLGSNESG